MTIREIAEQAKAAGSWIVQRRAAMEIRQMPGDDSLPLRFKLALLSSDTVAPLADFLTVAAAAEGIKLETYVGDFGQIQQEILNPQSDLYAFQPDAVLLIASPHSFGWPIVPPATSETEAIAADSVIATLASLVDAFHRHASGVFLPTTFPATPDWPFHIQPSGSMFALREVNRRIVAAFAGHAGVQVCDLDGLCAYYGYRECLSPEMLALAACPFSEMFLARLSEKILSHVRSRLGRARKCLVLDCDNVLWGGIVGEDGFDGIHLGPDRPGREFVEFQKAVLELFEQGVVLAVNSKNNAEDVRRVLAEHPHSLLREKHFAAIEANWNDKPANMRRIAEELKLGLDSFVFLDDNPAERDMMRQMLPEVLTLEMPANPALYARTLRETSCFAASGLTDEDRLRGAMYAAERSRGQLRQSVATIEDFLQSLEMKVRISKAAETDVRRIAQLTQRTNQFNVTTRRYGESEIAAFLADPAWRIYVLRACDRFGDSGLVGAAIVVLENGHWRIDVFLLSCRVIGRCLEYAFADRIVRDATAAGVANITAEYIPTQKNALAADFLAKAGFMPQSEENGRTVWRLNASEYQPKVFSFIQIET